MERDPDAAAGGRVPPAGRPAGTGAISPHARISRGARGAAMVVPGRQVPGHPDALVHRRLRIGQEQLDHLLVAGAAGDQAQRLRLPPRTSYLRTQFRYSFVCAASAGVKDPIFRSTRTRQRRPLWQEARSMR